MIRRSFLFTAGVAGLSQHAVGANDRVRLAGIGIRGQGRFLTGQFAAQKDVEIAWLCDIDPGVYERAAKTAEDRSNKKPPFVQDLRKVLDDKAIDGVYVATPDHWHAPLTILACNSGKDVYVEKPASHNIREGRLMIEAARKNNRVVQLGTQSRSRPSTIRAIELIHSGRIGKVLMAKAWDVQLRDHIGHKSDSAAPAGIDFETWTGPAQLLPFNENRFHYKWHWHWNFGTGDIGNDGIHQMDMARWALNVDLPKAAYGMGKKLFFDDDQQTPDTMNLTFDYGEKALQFEMRIWNPYGMENQENGVAVYGTTGMIHIGRWNGSPQWGFKVYDEKGKVVEDQSQNEDDRGDAHHRNFVDCIRSRKQPNADIQIGHTSTTLCHLGNIVARTGRNLRYDAKSETIVEDASANRLTRREYRQHWATPKGA